MMAGEVIAGRYRVEDELGRGGMGIVLRASDVRLDRVVALKMLRSDVIWNPELRLNLATEARIASAVSHPGIAAVYDFVEQDGKAFIVYEFVRGRTLREELASAGFNASDAVDAGVQLADALATAHERGIIHRDLKPENIMVTAANGSGRRLKILDFGLAKFISQPLTRGELTDTQTIQDPNGASVLMGTISYMAPEQLEGDRADARSDIFAVGVVLFEIATGTHPFRGRTPSSTIANVLKQETPSLLEHTPVLPGEFARIVTKCLRKSANERYQSARELLIDLANLRRDSASLPHPRKQETAHQSLFHRLFSFGGNSPFRRWEILHIRICLKCALLLVLTWMFFGYAPGTLGLVLSLSEAVTCTAVYGLITVLLYTGATDRSNLGRELRRLGRWIRTAAWISGALAWAMALTVAVSHPVFAALLLVLGVNLVGSIMVIKPATDRAALSEGIAD
jgi:serine/threonine protein kinase